MNKKSAAFSLIELIVVVAIVAVIAAVSLPSYQSYVLRSKVSKSIGLLSAIANEAILIHDTKGIWPDSFAYGDTIIFNQDLLGSTTAMNAGDIVNLAYYTFDQNDKITLIANLSGLEGIPGYVAPVGNDFPTNGAIRLVVGYENGVYQQACGHWDTSYNVVEVPLEYQSSKCQCQSLSDIYNNTLAFSVCH
jgi:prepilin-type N-terminal cleavage/methylation domain-containing protein